MTEREIRAPGPARLWAHIQSGLCSSSCLSVEAGWKYQNRKSQSTIVFKSDESVVGIFLSTNVREREDHVTHTTGGTRTWQSPSDISAKN